MTPFTRVEGKAYPLPLRNVDTDLIIPAVHLKTILRQGLGRHAFETLRAQPGNVFDDPRFAGAPILRSPSMIRSNWRQNAAGANVSQGAHQPGLAVGK